jgi:hypothetical protein
MSLELANVLASMFTALVIAATAIAALGQLRHMRMGNQISALLALQSEFDTQEFRDAEVLVRQDLARMIEDESFCIFLVMYSRNKESVALRNDYVQLRQAATLIANTYENLGALVKNGIIDRRLFLDIYSWIVAGSWSQLEGFVAVGRASSGTDSIFENFEYIAAISREWLDTNPVTYPPNQARLNARLPKAAEKLFERAKADSL